MNPDQQRYLGLTLITGGFLAGCLACVLDRTSVDLAIFVPAGIVAAIGVALAQLATRSEAKDEQKREANFKVIDSALASIVEASKELDATKDDIDIYDVPEWIDERFRENINTFVEAREAIAHIWGMPAYAKVMSHFAAGERYLNRVWSTAADGYIDEAQTFMGRSREELTEALAALEALKGGGPKVPSPSGQGAGSGHPVAAPGSSGPAS